MLDLKALLSKILDALKVDYVVEEGTSGGWNYRKWSSGIMECWYEGNPGTYTTGTQRGSMYAGGWITYNFPVAFYAAPTIIANVLLTTDAYVVLAQTSTLTATNVKVRIVASASISSSQNYTITIYAIGRWK